MSIEVKGLNFFYNKGQVFEKKALDDINMFIADGEFVGIIGHTGSGKSTLIQHFNALLTPDSGAVYLNGNDINADKTKHAEIRRKIGLVFQYPEHQLFEISVYKDVAFGLQFLNLPPQDVDRRVRGALKVVGLSEDYFEKSPFELSGGEKRRAAIAGVLAMEPEILILDEPTAGLDPKGRDEILEQIKILGEELKITVVLVSHSMEDVARLVDKVFVMADSKIVLHGSVGEVFANSELLESIGLAAPQITYLMKELSQRGFSAKGGVYTVNDAFRAIKDVLDE
ncbi:MAG: energy-coupling factor transporter ATPase [Clostridiales bacterium]|jgi:energy-coupling factor transport system ATP-binding protein|nr:energy-coupling factor transporter ATPase [Clostridiales bacterium]